MDRDLHDIVIVGAGHAGVETAAALRHRGFPGRITLVSAEPGLPYQRPPLSKEFLKSQDDSGLPLRGEAFYSTAEVGLVTGRRVEAIDRADARVRLDDGTSLAYDHLVLATGARNRMPPVAGLVRGEALELRSLADARALDLRLPALKHVAVIGGGFIGLEVAALLRARGVAVDVVEAMPRLMARVLSEPMSAHFRTMHEAMGTRLHLDVFADALHQSEAGPELMLANRQTIATDAVLVAAGIVPETDLAEAAGLTVDNGVVVDALLVTSDPAISAIGDAALFPNAYTGAMTRLESVQNAVDQGKAVAARLTGEPAPYAGFPWFWSNQGSARLQIAGLATGHDRVVSRGEAGSEKFSLYLYRGERLIAVESLNAAGDHMLARRLLAQGIFVPPEMAGDLGADLKALLPKAA
ncbi:MAG: NAD(P)/FAD-dependent oxidoreductase [Rhizobiaceae bacterium]